MRVCLPTPLGRSLCGLVASRQRVGPGGHLWVPCRHHAQKPVTCAAQTHSWVDPIGYNFYRHSFIRVLMLIEEKMVLRGTQPPKRPGTAPDPNAGDLAASTPSSSAH